MGLKRRTMLNHIETSLPALLTALVALSGCSNAARGRAGEGGGDPVVVPELVDEAAADL
jgi:hypothetical protein